MKGVLPPYPMSREVIAQHGRMPFLVLKRLNWLHGIVSPTALMTDVLVRHGVDPGLIVNKGYGIETGIRATPRLRFFMRPNRWSLAGFIGTLAPHKGCHVLIDAVCRLDPACVADASTAALRIFPTTMRTGRRRAGGVSNVTFCGTFPHHRIGEVLAGFHVLAVPSVWFENAPLVMQAAQAAKRPVICTSDLPVALRKRSTTA